jgi:pyruvate kinase
MTILFDDGYISGIITEVSSQKIHVKILNSGILKTGKGINIPDSQLPLPAMTKEDLLDLQFGCDHDVDFIAGSYIRSAKNIQEIRDALSVAGCPEIPIIAKIENREGIENFAEIANIADGILVARGDLGVEVDVAKVPRLQKFMIRTCCSIGKPVITATHMLESMIVNPRPTRAEVSDVANAVYDLSSSIMLSAETAVGKYPIDAVRMMKRIAQETEADIEYRDFFMQQRFQELPEIEASTALAAVRTAYAVGAKAIVIVGLGDTVIRFVARLRPLMPILALADTEKRFHQLGAMWGVFPVLSTQGQNLEIAFSEIGRAAQEQNFVTAGDTTLVLSGNLFQKKPTINMMVVSI